jgi:hypothetical protein
MTNPSSDAYRTERSRAFSRDARALQDDQLGGGLAEAEREVAELRRKLEDATAWCEALAAEKDRRAIQRMAG